MMDPESLFEALFLAWCLPYDKDLAPDHLRDDPVKGYGEYAFRKGFQLALALAAASLWE